jgi:hypothetical protein
MSEEESIINLMKKMAKPKGGKSLMEKMAKPKRKKNEYRLPLEPRTKESDRFKEIKDCILELQPSACIKRILACCRDQYGASEFNAHTDLFSDLHNMVDEGILLKRFDNKKEHGNRILYFVK